MLAESRTLWKNMLPSRSNKTQEILEPPSPALSTSSTGSTYSEDIEKVFHYIDSDGDGKISPSELRRCVTAIGGPQQLSAEEAHMAVECSDTDGDGLLDLTDFERLMGDNGLSEAEKMAELREAFAMYSDSGKKSMFRVRSGSSGYITAKSLKKMLGRLGESRSIKECKAMIRVYDMNGDGVLSFDEFALMMR